jgi:hypothetical protein
MTLGGRAAGLNGLAMPGVIHGLEGAAGELVLERTAGELVREGLRW